MKEVSPKVKELLGEYRDITEMVTYWRKGVSPNRVLAEEARWEVPEEFAIKVAPVGAYITRKGNPNQVYSTTEIREQLMDSIDAGACAIHVHCRTPEGHHTLDLKLVHEIIDPIKEKYGRKVLIDGCPEGGRTFDESTAPLIEFKDVIETAPITCAAVWWADSLTAVTEESVIGHVKIMQELGQKPELVVHDAGSIDQAYRWVIRPGIYKKPTFWRLCLGEPSLGTMYSPEAMMDLYTYCIRRILEIDADAKVLISMCGRGALWQMAFSALMSPPVIGVRMGMEDSIWMYPHKDEKIPDNPTIIKAFVDILKLIGRRPATADEFRKAIGIN